MFLFNPLYVLSNVIYADTTTGFIFIDSNCWNRLFNGVFRDRRPSVQEIRKLKKVCYDLYIHYMQTKEVSTNKFNSEVALLQGLEVTVQSMDALVVSSDQEEVIRMSTDTDGFFLDRDHFNKPDEIEDYVVKQNEDEVSRFKEFLNEASVLINLSITESQRQNQLVTLIGFNRILSIFRVLALSKSVSLYNKYEIEFFKRDPSLLQLALRYKSESYSFFCEECMKIGDHHNIRLENRMDMETHAMKREISREQTLFFDQKGWINFEDYAQYNLNHSLEMISFDYKSEDFHISGSLSKSMSIQTLIQYYIPGKMDEYYELENIKKEQKKIEYRNKLFSSPNTIVYVQDSSSKSKQIEASPVSSVVKKNLFFKFK